MKLNGRCFPQIVDRDSGISIQYIHLSLGLILNPKGGGKKGRWGGLEKYNFMFSSRFMLFPTFIFFKSGRGGGVFVKNKKISFVFFFSFYAICQHIYN